MEREIDLFKIINENPSPLLVLDNEGNVLYSNDAAGKNKILEQKTTIFKKRPKEIKAADKVFFLTYKKIEKNLVIDFTDITKLKKAEAFNEGILNSMSDGLIVTDLLGGVINVNKSFLRMYGLKKKGVVGKFFLELPTAKPWEIEKYIKIIKDVIKKGSVGPIEMEDKRGRYTSFTGSLLKDEKNTPSALICVTRDITDNKKVVDALKESEEKFKDLSENADDLIQSVDRNGNFVYVNKKWKKVLGYSDKDIKKLDLTNILRKDQIPHCMEILKKVSRGESVSDLETVFVSKRGREIPVEGNANALIKDGRFIATRGIFRNISKHKKVEKELLETRKNLETIKGLLARHRKLK
jgi:PAS domain S-box-containing protein